MNTTTKYEFIDHRIQKLDISNELRTAIDKGGEIPPVIKLGYSFSDPRIVETTPTNSFYVGNIVLSIECTAADQEKNLLTVNARIEGVFSATTNNYDENDFRQFLGTYGITELYVYSVGFLSGLIPQLGKLCSFSFPFLSSKNFTAPKREPEAQKTN